MRIVLAEVFQDVIRKPNAKESLGCYVPQSSTRNLLSTNDILLRLYQLQEILALIQQFLRTSHF